MMLDRAVMPLLVASAVVQVSGCASVSPAPVGGANEEIKAPRGPIYGATERFEGIFATAFELSAFEGCWMTFTEAAYREFERLAPTATQDMLWGREAEYRVVFIGRKTVPKKADPAGGPPPMGHYGHLSMFRCQIEAADFISVEKIPSRPRGASTVGKPLDRLTIERIESGLALKDDLVTVGVGDTAEMNRNSRVRIRNVDCSAPDGGGVTCTYDATRCSSDEDDPDGDGWCRRTRRFVPASNPEDAVTSANGWTADAPQR